MGLSIKYVQPGLPSNETAIAEAKPHIRLLSVASVEAHGANSSATALDEVLGFSERWTSAPDAVTAGNFSSFSAVNKISKFLFLLRLTPTNF